MFTPVFLPMSKDISQPSEGAFSQRCPRCISPAEASKSKKIALPTAEGFLFEKVKRIVYLEASGNYTTVHFAEGRPLLLSRTLGEMCRILPKERFFRIHRSYVVHLRHIVRYHREKHGSIELSNGKTLSISPNYRQAFLSALSDYFCGFPL